MALEARIVNTQRRYVHYTTLSVVNAVTVSGKPCSKTRGQYLLICSKGLACGPIKSLGSVSHVVVAGGIEPVVSIVEIYNVKENTWAAGKKKTS